MLPEFTVTWRKVQ